MPNFDESKIATIPVSRTTLKWLRDVTTAGRYDQADPDTENFESHIWDVENINVGCGEWEEFLNVLYANTDITKDNISEYRYLDIYVDVTL